MNRLLLCLLLALLMSRPMAAQTYQPTWASIDSRPVPAWFENAKFGIFIHWGLFSVPAFGPTARDGVGVYDRYAEWYWQKSTDPKSPTYAIFNRFQDRVYGKDVKYPDFVKGFTCELFKPDEWAELFRQAGARYVVLTSKHHEGFTLWPSAQSWNWNAVDVGPHRDLAGDLMKAVRAKDLRMGYYYSLYEWFNPLYKRDVNAYVDQHMLPQLKDLVTRYKPDVVWTDGEWDHPSATWKSTEFLAWLYNESPVKNDVVVNDRWGKETRSKHGGIYTTEYDLVHDANSAGMTFSHPWEECRGIGSSFGYNRAENLDDYSTSTQLVGMLIDKVARGGNLLLNIGPTADGRIPVIMQQRLRDIGDWLAVNGEAIYDTRKWDAAPAVTPKTTVYYTRKGTDLYAICTQWPTQPLAVPLARKPARVTLLGYKGAVTLSNGKIVPPAITPATIPCQHAWTFKLAGVL